MPPLVIAFKQLGENIQKVFRVPFLFLSYKLLDSIRLTYDVGFHTRYLKTLWNGSVDVTATGMSWVVTVPEGVAYTLKSVYVVRNGAAAEFDGLGVDTVKSDLEGLVYFAKKAADSELVFTAGVDFSDDFTLKDGDILYVNVSTLEAMQTAEVQVVVEEQVGYKGLVR